MEVAKIMAGEAEQERKDSLKKQQEEHEIKL